MPYEKRVNNSTLIQIKKGDSLNAITAKLGKKGLVNSEWLFKWASIFMGKRRSYKSGKYIINGKQSIFQLVQMLDKGDTTLLKVTIPEGLRMTEVFSRLSKAGFANSGRYFPISQDKEFIKSLGLGKTINALEGFLFPETYKFAKELDEASIIETMVKTFQKNIPKNYKKLANKVDLTFYQAVILASIIEKETGVYNERAIIASVFHNRLKRKMRLQTDPTVIYGIKNFDGNLTRRHMQTHNPYNTYIIRGLPPTPIANPGLESLMAAVQPANTKYLYFVAKGDGTHKFTSTYKDHYQYVKKFQRKRRADYRSY